MNILVGKHRLADDNCQQVISKAWPRRGLDLISTAT